MGTGEGLGEVRRYEVGGNWGYGGAGEGEVRGYDLEIGGNWG